MAKSEIPVPLALLDVPNMTANKLKRLAVSASGTLNFWSALRSTIASVTTVDGNVDDGSNAERMVLLPGGAFVLMIGNDGSPTLFRVDSAAPPRGGDSPFGRGPSDGRPRQEPRPIKHHVFHAPDGRLQILVGRDYE
ncbi:hypothetical protein GLOTRDRAFT_91129 [Gloeophyllum trabeum ATCC 11539]|uniref:Uncharacterized protein n=1 Tax=Gloeophyllum trabeum (strain ATCC 11539 / FP-39264 / Madison 617) TaxID=670483 RepID=S7QJR2_GLOTA|nr:uncharacterized protein GLOTRDRAFT_91129 [Gloeophyllum trabeum ATCC 11539]EPQ59577.1 hypothetical protein GLOTRDRAFT_91129 [Gloeophyllum trabeum ATCC 11539]